MHSNPFGSDHINSDTNRLNLVQPITYQFQIFGISQYGLNMSLSLNQHGLIQEVWNVRLCLSQNGLSQNSANALEHAAVQN
jgi:hypothetical protein